VEHEQNWAARFRRRSVEVNEVHTQSFGPFSFGSFSFGSFDSLLSRSNRPLTSKMHLETDPNGSNELERSNEYRTIRTI